MESLQNSEKLKIFVRMKGTFGGHLLSTVMLSVILDISHYHESQMGVIASPLKIDT